MSFYFFFFNDTATTEIYTLSLHDALPIYHPPFNGVTGFTIGSQLPLMNVGVAVGALGANVRKHGLGMAARDRKSTRLNSSHMSISYAVFCLKKKKKTP